MQARNTRQKQIVDKVMGKATRPLTVHEILAGGKKFLPSLGLATVYRELNRLVETGEIQTVTIPGDPPRYEIAKQHHHHFKCTKCDNVYELEGCLKEITKLVPKGFKAESHDITLYGLCRACA